VVLRQIVLLSGPVRSGKSTLAAQLAQRFGFSHIRTHRYIEDRNPGIERERGALQQAGEKLDRRTQGAWVCENILQDDQDGKWGDNAAVIVDAVRIKGQIDAIRRAYGQRVVHVHLTAPPEELAQRYESKDQSGIREFSSYDDVQRASRTERRVDALGRIADIVIDTKQNTREDVLTRAAAHLGLYGRDYPRLVDVLVGGQYGSEGKGQIAAYLAPEYDVLVRVGGPNAGHSVYAEPEARVFHHLPSGTDRCEADLVIGPGAVLNVGKLLQEVGEAALGYGRLHIDPQAMVISEQDIAAEKELCKAIGSTGQGVGAATARKIMGRSGGVHLARDEHALRPFLAEACAFLDEAFRMGRHVLLEGTQGTGLSLHHGPYPYVTSRDTTVAGCLAEAGISANRVRKVVMVCRTYPIRVESPRKNTSGPFSQEIDWALVAERSGIPLAELEAREKTSTTRRRRRVGEFDWVLLRKAASLNAPTDIALTFVDYLHPKNQKARRFEQLEKDTIRFIEEVERVAAAPVSLISTRFHFRSIIDRRAWHGGGRGQ
jgi:adenylosuccinate synthase